MDFEGIVVGIDPPLPPHPEFDEAIGGFLVLSGQCMQQRTSVILSLQQAVQHNRLETAHFASVLLQRDEPAEVVSQQGVPGIRSRDVSESVPPALTVALPNPAHQPVPVRRVGDAVAVEQIADIAAIGNALAGLQPAYLGDRALERLGDLVDGEPGLLTQRAKLRTEPAPRHHRTTCWGHRTPPPFIARMSRMSDYPREGENRHATPLR